jgi:hypothetical protein
MAIAPPFRLASSGARGVALESLLAAGPAVLLFAESDCPTCALALRELARAGAPVQPVFQDPPAVATRVARRLGVRGEVLFDEAPYDVSRAYDVQTVPTTVLVGRDGVETARVVGWDRAALEALLARAAALGAPATPPLDPATPATKPGCASRSTYDAPPPLDDELEEMFERGFSDGLPVVPPTPARVEAMLGRADPDEVLGLVPPALGEATLERVAACAVLAGCKPSYFGVVVAAVEAALDPAFNVNALAVTTSPPGQIVIVNGPIRRELGMQTGMGALGPGFRPNLTIGRALRLVVHLTGGGAPGTLDRSTLGHPGKIATCIAEDEEGSPWQPLHVERGFDPGASTVTVVGGDAPLSISDHRSRTPEALAACLGFAGAATWSPNWWPMDATSLYVICPEHAALFREAGWSKARVREAIAAAPRRTAADLRSFGETPPEVHAAAPDAVFGKWARTDDVQLVCAGGEAGRFSAVFGPALGFDSAMTTREVRRWTT